MARDDQGKVYTVRYEAVNAMLLNEFLKEHRKVQELETTVAQQQKQIEALTATVQKVSDKIELNRPAPQIGRRRLAKQRRSYQRPRFTPWRSGPFYSSEMRAISFKNGAVE